MENIRSYKKLNVTFEKGITVLTGRTGSGKSTILMSIEYALFGASKLSSGAILRRGANAGRITLTFEHNGSEWEITRALKKTKDKIQSDNEILEIKKDGETLNIMNRINDFDEKIIQILGFDKEKNANELFNILTYTRQDEIKELISMKREKRQEFIDRILQLSKYKTAWTNLKPITDHFLNKILTLQGILKYKNNIEQEAEELKKMSEQKMTEKEKEEKELIILKSEEEEEEKETEKLQKEWEEKRKIREENLMNKARLETLRKRKENIAKELTQLQNQLAPAKEEIWNEETFEKMISENEKVNTIIGAKKYEIKQTENEEREFLKLDKKICPTCKQEINEIHLHNLKMEYEQKKERLTGETNSLEQRAKQIKGTLDELRKRKNELLKINSAKIRVEELKKEIETAEYEELNYTKKISETEIINFEETEILLKQKKEKLNKTQNKILTTRMKIDNLKESLADIKNRREKKILEQEKTKKQEKEFKETLEVTAFLEKLREDIRNIREIVRQKFLDEFKTEFHKNFEEIRHYEEEYIVDVKNDYEPVAYSGQGEVNIETLSGGERTSVALAYRLALSNIAAEMSGINKTQLLILDEPTVGFDDEDVKSLPLVLKKIQIPQIIIVTHEEELKDAADYNYKVEKKNGISQIVRE